MICYVCKQDNWKKRPDLNKKRLFLICQSCGNMAYEVDPKEEERIKNYYKKDYRGNINYQVLLTTSRKLNYIRVFLKDLLKEKKGQKLVTTDVGCATGYIVDWFNKQGHDAYGSEWTTDMRRFAENYYGLYITEEIDTKRKYDLITLYHVFEHLIEPNKKLDHYMSTIKRMAIS